MALVYELGFLNPCSRGKYPFIGMMLLQHFSIKNELICFQSIPCPIFIRQLVCESPQCLDLRYAQITLSFRKGPLSFPSQAELVTTEACDTSASEWYGHNKLHISARTTRQQYFLPPRCFLSPHLLLCVPVHPHTISSLMLLPTVPDLELFRESWALQATVTLFAFFFFWPQSL